MPQEIRAQTGPQEAFLSSPADIAIYGGAAGGGKTFALLLEALRHYQVPRFTATIFRRVGTDIQAQGGLWDESCEIYPGLGALSNHVRLEWTFPSGAAVKFSHLQYEKDVHHHQGSQICLLGFDELTHFTEKQFWYMLSRNRSVCGVAPYVRATTNPDVDSWVATFIAWWIDQETGYPIPERSGVLRWFVRVENALVWGSRAGLLHRYPDLIPKSATFIPAQLSDNPALERKDPGYRANLMALQAVERARLLGGNWKVRPVAGSFFRREWFEIVDVAPAQVQGRVRYWDRASTKPIGENTRSKVRKDPDWTVGLKMSRNEAGLFFVEHVLRLRDTPLCVERSIVNTAGADGCTVGFEEDPGSSGKYESAAYVRLLAGHDIRVVPVSGQGDKSTRARPMSAQAEAGNVKLVRGPWNEAFLSELENFPTAEAHDDQVDAFSGAGKVLTNPRELGEDAVG